MAFFMDYNTIAFPGPPRPRAAARNLRVNPVCLQVIKVGTSSLLRADQGSLNISNLARLCETVRDMHRKGAHQCANPHCRTPFAAVMTSPAHDVAPSQTRALGKWAAAMLISGSQRLALLHLPAQLRQVSCVGHKVVIVSSGAIGVGCLRLGLKERPSAIAQKQALAAVGQVHLMRYYEDFFSAVGLVQHHSRLPDA